MSDVWTTIANYVLAPAGAVSLLAGIAMAVIGARAKRDVARSSHDARVAESEAKVAAAEARSRPYLLRRIESQDAKIDTLAARLDECEEKHDRAEKRAVDAEQKNEKCDERTRDLEEKVEALLQRVDRDDTGRFEVMLDRALERRSQSSPSLPAIPPPTKRRGE
jgi:septal ring factor EnvC (AmiA/AmiB activator)